MSQISVSSILILMSKTKRFQIPVSPTDEALFKNAARVDRVSAAEWARRILVKAAQESLGTAKMSREDALDQIFGLNAPVSKVDTMIEESIRGRFTE